MKVTLLPITTAIFRNPKTCGIFNLIAEEQKLQISCYDICKKSGLSKVPIL